MRASCHTHLITSFDKSIHILHPCLFVNMHIRTYVYTCTFFIHEYVILCMYILYTSLFAVYKGEVVSIPNTRVMTGWGQWVWVSREGWLKQTKNGKPATVHCRMYILGYVIACVHHIPYGILVLYVLGWPITYIYHLDSPLGAV